MTNEETSPSGMIQYLETVLHEIEKQQGGSDPEAAAALEELKTQTAALARLHDLASGKTADIDQGEAANIAAALDKLDERLGDLEAMIDSADDSTREILQSSTELWLAENPEAKRAIEADQKGREQDQFDENGPISRRVKHPGAEK